jgi:uncharacterized protein (TIGR03905 family)
LQHHYKTRGVCSRSIDFELEGDVVKSVSFEDGCDGNLKAIAKMVEGMPAQKVIDMFSGITCERKKTSCADQFAKALTEALEKENV